MKINRIQLQIFKKYCKENELDIDEYIKKNSSFYIGRAIENIGALSEQEGDTWIHKLYLENEGLSRL